MFLIHLLNKIVFFLVVILFIFRKDADSANSFSKVGLLGAKLVVAIESRLYPALLLKSRF